MILRRLGQTLSVILIVVGVSFLILQLTGDPVRVMLGPEAGEAQVSETRQRLGFNDSVLTQLWRHYGRVLRGDFGRSWRFREPALPIVLQRLPATLILTVAALGVSVCIAVPLGVAAAARRGSLADSFTIASALAGQSMPVFWIGILLVLAFSVTLRVLPTSGYGTIAHAVLPSVALGAYSAGRLARLVRAQVLEVLGQDHVRTAWAKGLRPRVVLYKHAVRAGLLPVVTLLGLEFGTLMGGAIVVETVFAWPGIGLLAVQSITGRDYPVVLTIVFFMGLVFSLVNLATDVLYTWLDPRIREL